MEPLEPLAHLEVRDQAEEDAVGRRGCARRARSGAQLGEGHAARLVEERSEHCAHDAGRRRGLERGKDLGEERGGGEVFVLCSPGAAAGRTGRLRERSACSFLRDKRGVCAKPAARRAPRGALQRPGRRRHVRLVRGEGRGVSD